MIWSDIVGQVANGGIAQFFDNFSSVLELAVESVTRIGWLELTRNYQAASNQYVNVNGKSVSPKKWREERAKLWEKLREEARKWDRRHGLEPQTGADLDRSVMRRQAMGLIRSLPARAHPAVEAFNDWFFSDAARVGSELHVAGYILRNRDRLVRVIQDA